MYCKKCGRDSWECVAVNIVNDEPDQNLYQCNGCSRVVCASLEEYMEYNSGAI